MKTAVLILAAGESKRMGRSKQLLSCGDKSFIEKTIENFRGLVDEIYVVLGAGAKEIRERIKDEDIRIILNENYQEGMGSSLRAGVEVLLEKEIGMFFISLCDMPHLKRETIRKILEAGRETKGKIVVPAFQGKKGHPVLFPDIYLPEMLEVAGDEGARGILRRHGQEIYIIELDDQAVIEDIDTMERYEDIRRREKWS